MKSFAGSATLVIAASLFDAATALEHPLLTSTADYRETWIERPETAEIGAKAVEAT